MGNVTNCCVSRGERHKLSNEFINKERALKRQNFRLSAEPEPERLIDENPFDFGIERKKPTLGSVSVTGPRSFTVIKAEDVRQAYKFGDIIIKGIYGNVYYATHRKTGHLRSIRLIKRVKKKDDEKFLSMVKILRFLDHPNVENVLDVYADEQYFYLVTELFSGGELFDRIAKEKYFTEALAARYIRDILSGIAFCHRQGIVHRDIMPENLLFENEKQDSCIKITNFGLATTLTSSGGISGSFSVSYYTAPEAIRGNYNHKCDIWSCGIILYIMLCGYPPFHGQKDEEIRDAILKGELAFDEKDWIGVSEESKQFIRKLLNNNPQDRISAQEALEDPWLKKLCEDKDAKELSTKALVSLSGFNAQNKFQKLIMSFMATQVITPEQKQELARIFQELDIDKNGLLTEDEIIEGIEKLPAHQRISPLEASKLFHEIDIDNSGTIEFGEFVAAMFNQDQIATKKQIESAFKILDANDDGYLEKEEIEKAMGLLINEEEWKRLFSSENQATNTKISLKEFTELITNQKLNSKA